MSKRFPQAILILWMAALIIGSLLPERIKDAIGTTAGVHPHVHPLVHVAAFGATALLLVSISRSPSQKLAALLAVITIGICLEILQHFLYKSRFERWDVLNDTLSATAGYLLARSKVVSRAVGGMIGLPDVVRQP